MLLESNIRNAVRYSDPNITFVELIGVAPMRIEVHHALAVDWDAIIDVVRRVIPHGYVSHYQLVDAGN